MIRAIADLEVASYTSMVDVRDVQSALDIVKYHASHLLDEDEELSSAFDIFYSDIENHDNTYMKLEAVKEVSQE